MEILIALMVLIAVVSLGGLLYTKYSKKKNAIFDKDKERIEKMKMLRKIGKIVFGIATNVGMFVFFIFLILAAILIKLLVALKIIKYS